MKKQSKLSAPSLSALIIGVVLPLAPVLLYAVMLIDNHFNPQPGAEFGFLLLYPIVLIASLALFLEGIFLIVTCIAKRDMRKKNRFLLAGIGIIIWLPAIYCGYGMWASWYVKDNANRVISNQTALNLVQECKVEGIVRDNNFRPTGNLVPTAKLYLKEWAKIEPEKSSPFYGYRSFAASYYDELYKITQSDAVRQKCGYIDYSDADRDSQPDTAKWATVEEAKQVIDTCSINEVFTNQKFEENQLANLSNPNESSTGIFMSLRPNPHGYFGRLYIANASEQTKADILAFANKKKPVCVYHLPNIIESTY